MARSNGAGRHDLTRVPEPIAGFPAMPTSQHNGRREISPVAVVDAYDERRRVRALARIDLLDRECRAGRIDHAALEAGREIEKMFERMARISGVAQWFQTDHVDAASAAELQALVGLERAFAVNAFLGWLVRNVGKRDTRLLWLVLGERFSLALAAAAFQRPGVRGLRYTRDRLADALDTLASAKAARGRAAR
jgi:hypothetical protein